ncbi:hypothetical protein TrVGV298_005104 [Trichoderma virens]|nr:hypothetical protein TrVGV298_005104 [Trichoderma virens]
MTNINPNHTDKFQLTALHWAAFCGNLEITKALLKHHKVNCNFSNRLRWNALHYFADRKHNSAEIAELLIKAGTDPLAQILWMYSPKSLEAKTDKGYSVLRSGIGSVESVEWLMRHGADGNTRDLVGDTPLIKAAMKGLDKTVSALLSHGCNAELVNKEGRTALHFAAKSGHVAIGIKLLEKHKKLLSSRDTTNLTAIHYAIRNGQGEFTKMLLNEFYPKVDNSTLLGDLCAKMASDGETPLISAVRTGQCDIVRRLLELGVETEQRDKHGFTALLEAVEKPTDISLEMIRALLDTNMPNHANVNSGGGVYPTALHNAAECGKLEVVEELIKLGARVNAEGGEKKADPNLSAGRFANTLSVALFYQTHELVAPLLKAGVNINATDRVGRSNLYIATLRQSWDIMKQLLKESDSLDDQGRT